jgi:hypothetical protein
MKKLKAIAVVDRDKPVLKVLDIYALTERNHLYLQENEKIINITITADEIQPDPKSIPALRLRRMARKDKAGKNSKML